MTAPLIYNYSNITYEFLAVGQAKQSPFRENEWSYPAFCTLIAPPETGKNQTAVFNRTPDNMMHGEWVIVPDHRGETWYTESGESVTIKELGDPTIDGLLQEKPPEPEKPIIYPSLTARQFWQAALVIGVTEEQLVVAITTEGSPLYIADETERNEVKIDITKATSFNRDFPLVNNLAAINNISESQLNDLWLWASRLE
ncbi:hypothetical protein N5853_11065 [Bartonella sp. HY329]|uniref:hypothetical protein n=1 Tax=unclassified Bartonella TaxID=2645622 RepID=UPI0021C84363|nr:MULTISPECIES: hypothetical protein [unclassified Bartonella]UXM94632.1 hypothetical protein N5853_11065 [Bartonella sp. HY329]UXN08955.1 hypothetical protein N5852_11075 [Bartonella sp. HY328]